jgi:hypothetical protein
MFKNHIEKQPLLQLPQQEFSVQLTYREQWNDERLKFNDLGGKLVKTMNQIMRELTYDCAKTGILKGDQW